MNTTIQHVAVLKRDLAERIVEEAKKPGADFDALYEKYSIDRERKKGMVPNLNVRGINMVLGEAALEPIQNAKAGDILGPVVGVKGFEVMLVKSITLPYTRSFEEVKTSIIGNLKKKKMTDYRQGELDKIKKEFESQTVKSPEILDMEKEAEEKAAEARRKADEARQAREAKKAAEAKKAEGAKPAAEPKAK